MTPRVSPFTKLDSWEARKTKAGASSAGWAGRPTGFVPPNWETVSPGIEAGMIGVHTGPGATVFARSPYPATSWASPLVNVTMAPFVAALGRWVGEGWYAWMEATLIMEPPSCMCGSAAFTSQNIA